jgi:N-carbamoyl-L-amino-acid hydrolase
MTIETALSLQDAEGVGLGQALKAVGYLGSDTAPRDALAFVELHVEQGPVLEQCGAQIGLVERAWAARKMRLRFLGEPAHTGPTAKNKRRDALRAAASFIAAAHDIADAAPGEPILSIARIENAPNSSNVIACETRLWIEIRHPLEEVCQAIGQQLLTLVEDSRILGGCKFEVEQDLLRQSISLDKAGRQLAMEACLAQGVSWRVLPTVAGHDALALARVMPTTLLFVPSQAGISHSPKEFTRPEAMLTGLRLLVEWLHRRLRDETLP